MIRAHTVIRRLPPDEQERCSPITVLVALTTGCGHGHGVRPNRPPTPELRSSLTYGELGWIALATPDAPPRRRSSRERVAANIATFVRPPRRRRTTLLRLLHARRVASEGATSSGHTHHLSPGCSLSILHRGQAVFVAPTPRRRLSRRTRGTDSRTGVQPAVVGRRGRPAAVDHRRPAPREEDSGKGDFDDDAHAVADTSEDAFRHILSTRAGLLDRWLVEW